MTSRASTSTRSTPPAPPRSKRAPTRCGASPTATTQASPRHAPPTRRCASQTPTRSSCCAPVPSSSSPSACGPGGDVRELEDVFCTCAEAAAHPSPGGLTTVDLTFTDEQLAFRDELRAWLHEQPARRRARAARTPGYAWRTRLAAPPPRGRLGRRALAQGVRRPRRVADGDRDLLRGARPRAARRCRPTCSACCSPARRSWSGAPTSRRSATCRRSSPPRRSGARASPSPRPARTSPALKTRAVKDGDDWVVTGQKVWTSGAQYSKWCMLVARTDQDAPKHKGLTYFLMDMEQDAVQVRPLRQITGEAGVQRALHRGGADPRRERRRRRRQRLEGRAHDADERARRPRASSCRSACASSLDELYRRGRRDGRARRPADRRQARRPAPAHRDPAPDRLPRA